MDGLHLIHSWLVSRAGDNQCDVPVREFEQTCLTLGMNILETEKLCRDRSLLGPRSTLNIHGDDEGYTPREPYFGLYTFVLLKQPTPHTQRASKYSPQDMEIVTVWWWEYCSTKPPRHTRNKFLVWLEPFHPDRNLPAAAQGDPIRWLRKLADATRR